ncbi:MAG TPA: hypothetical protein VGQ00_03955 [Candidatus Norongarragalinales archaeon]|nr:hypothetical protein [Candidatus Norongarragalinales archaeon]
MNEGLVEMVEKIENKAQPNYNVKIKGHEGYAGRGWLNQGKYGPYISVKLSDDVQKGSTLYLYPRKLKQPVASTDI